MRNLNSASRQYKVFVHISEKKGPKNFVIQVRINPET